VKARAAKIYATHPGAFRTNDRQRRASRYFACDGMACTHCEQRYGMKLSVRYLDPLVAVQILHYGSRRPIRGHLTAPLSRTFSSAAIASVNSVDGTILP